MNLVLLLIDLNEKFHLLDNFDYQIPAIGESKVILGPYYFQDSGLPSVGARYFWPCTISAIKEAVPWTGHVMARINNWTS